MGTRLLVPLLLVLLSNVSAVKRPSLSKWELVSYYPRKHVVEAGGGVLGDWENELWYVVIGGFRFPNATGDVWGLKVWPQLEHEMVELKPMPEWLTHMAQAIDRQYFYGAGGFLGDHPGKSVRSVWRYDIFGDEWKQLPDLPAPRAGGGLVVVDRRWLVFSGGVNRPERSLRFHFDHGDTWSLDLWNKGEGWRNDNAPIPVPRNHMAGVDTCNRYLWVGGQKKNNEWAGNSKAVTEYIPWDRKWLNATGSPAWLPQAFGHISASVMPWNCGIVVVGGTGWRRRTRNEVLWWHPSSNRWVWIAAYPGRVATPVCGIFGRNIICGTGETQFSNRIYMASIL